MDDLFCLECEDCGFREFGVFKQEDGSPCIDCGGTNTKNIKDTPPILDLSELKEGVKDEKQSGSEHASQ